MPSSSYVDRSATDPRVQGIADTPGRVRALMNYDATNLLKSQGRWKTADKLAWTTIAALGAGVAAPALLGAGAGAGAAGAGTVNGLQIAPYAGTAAMHGAGTAAVSAGSAIPWMRIGELGTGLYSNYMGNRAQGKANDRDFAYRTAADERAYTMAEQQEAQRQKEWAAQQAMSEKAFQAQQEQLRLDREEERRQNAIAEAYAAANEGRNVARENQRVPYRQAGQIALRDLVSGLR